MTPSAIAGGDNHLLKTRRGEAFLSQDTLAVHPSGKQALKRNIGACFRCDVNKFRMMIFKRGVRPWGPGPPSLSVPTSLPPQGKQDPCQGEKGRGIFFCWNP